jgi:ankyrin repeat protein
VLVNEGIARWTNAVLVRVGDTIDVNVNGWNKMTNMPRTKVLVPVSNGAGALLRAAAAAGSVALVGVLLGAGVSTFVADARANTPLHVAAAAGHLHVCKALLAAGAEKGVNNAQMQTPAELAGRHKQSAIVRLFNPTLSDGEFTDIACTSTERLKAAATGDVETLRKTRDEGKITALMVACRAKKLVAAEVLAPKNVNGQSGEGCTALYLAAEEGAEDIVRLLLGKCAADANLAASDGSTPLTQACRFGHDPCVRELVKANANVNHDQANNGRTALMQASTNGHDRVVRALLENGANASYAKADGWTALMFCCQNGHEQCARDLLKAGANVDHQNLEQWTSLMYACQNGHEQVARALLEAGADRTKELPGYAGWNAFKLAERHGHSVVCDLLRR